MGYLEIILLGIIQGIAEFLPISSSGHLVVANALLQAMGHAPAEDMLEVNVVLHLGTLLAVLVHYRREIVRMFTRDKRVAVAVVLATIPAAIVGIGIKKGLSDYQADQILENVLLVGCLFPVTAMMLVFAMRRTPGDTDYTEISYSRALLIGLAQAFAILPGISRSGTTIAAGIACGLRRESAATFAFLMAIPAIAGAGFLEGLDILEEGATGTPIAVLVVGFVVSFVVGWGSLLLLIRFVRQGTLSIFAWYLVPLGIAVVTWQLLG
ncbi:undecaprenyl-diphosphate phosphatase [Aeoliella sp. SH292]|uniref:undecaprenyl-diphosphate phosphatase n=1 Tax=Aeoliella sp. SH292 TaxID=3454464 RepID=UPI003F94A06D